MGTIEILWLQNILTDLRYSSKKTMKLYCDNKAACEIAADLVHHDRTKHVEVDGFFIQDKLG